MDQPQTMSHPPVDYARPVTRGPIVNARMLVFFGVFVAIFGTLAYMYLDSTLSRGIHTRADGSLEVDLKAMSTFPFDQSNGTIDDVPAHYRELDGKKVVLVGEMYAPSSAGAGVNQFDLVYSIAKCCFSGPPQIQHFVKSQSSQGQPLPFYNGPVRTTGTLKVNVTKDPDGKITGVYHLAVDSIEPV